jgi:hypothetical protein
LASAGFAPFAVAVLGLFVPVTKFSKVDDPTPGLAVLFHVDSGTVAMAVFVLALAVIQFELLSAFSCPWDMRCGRCF